MGIFSQISNKKKKTLEKHTLRKKRLSKAIKKAIKGPAAINIPDADLLSTDMLKNKIKNPNNNIKLSNKKRKRILKRLGHQRRTVDNAEDDEDKDEEMVEAEEDKKFEAIVSKPSTSSASTSQSQSKKRTRGGRKKNKGKKGGAAGTEDVDMEEEG